MNYSKIKIQTIGQARGHSIKDQFDKPIPLVSTDRTIELLQKICAEKQVVKAKISHDGKVSDIFGKFSNFIIEDGSLKGDLELNPANGQHENIKWIFDNVGSEIGFSVIMMFDYDVRDDGTAEMLPTEIFSIDVETEAALTNGLFSIGKEIPDKNLKGKKMNQEDIQKLIDESIQSLVTRIEALETKLGENETKVAELAIPTEEQIEAKMEAKLKAAFSAGITPVASKPIEKTRSLKEQYAELQDNRSRNAFIQKHGFNLRKI